MEEKNILDTTVIYDKYYYNSKDTLRKFLESDYLKNIIKSVSEKCIIVLGGDGTMLRVIQENYHKHTPFLGVNFGTKGFLLNEKEFLYDTNLNFKRFEYPLLDLQVRFGDIILKHVAFNDIQIKSASGRALDLNFEIENSLTRRVLGDGILISTPAGSTAYNKSAHGLILNHESNDFIVTPICPYGITITKPVIFKNDYSVKVTNNNERKRRLSIYTDSNDVIEGTQEDIELIVKKYKEKVAIFIEENYIKLWKEKILAEQGYVVN
ncbi:NAD(+)/NADH kinase [Candidatus Gracilibacteria bacterium]|nr:NAD(+)/NADH kinase [Candidatus Gracilibacteria bacterium]